MGNWTPLARMSDGIGVSRCPDGHIHVDYRFATLRFGDEEFLAFARMMAEAARKVRASPFALAVDEIDDGPVSRN